MTTTRTSRRPLRSADAPRTTSAAWDVSGRRYLVDECRHQLVIAHPDGRIDRIGRRGSGIAEFAYPHGLALLQAPHAEAARVFVCDTLNHRVQVFDGTGQPRCAFGGYGCAAGQLAAPTDVALVSPDLPHDPPSRALLLAVADRWNGRIQIFTLDGLPIASIGARMATPRPGIAAEAGWPFFRLLPDPVLAGPCALAWRAPFLHVTTAEGRHVRIDLALAMLPAFDAWLASATAADRERALRYFHLLGASRRQVPASILAAVAGRMVA